jgi:DedD protein
MKQRMVGAIVLVALAVIFIPMLLEDKEPPVDAVTLEKQIPREPSTDYRTDLIPTEKEAEEAAIDSRTTMEIPLETITEPERPPELPETEAEREATAIEEARKEEWVIVEEKPETAPEKRATEAVESAPKTEVPTVVETPPAAPIGKGWTIQAGSFGQKANAETVSYTHLTLPTTPYV